MNKVKISEIALETGKTSKEVLAICEALGIAAKAQNSQVTYEQAEKVAEYLISGQPLPEPKDEKKPAKPKKKEQKEPEEKKSETKEAIKSTKAPTKASTKTVKAPEPKEPAKEENPMQLARKQSGLRIVTKKNRERPTASSTVETFEYGKQRVASAVAVDKKKKKEKKPVIQTGKKESGERLDLLLDRGLDSSDTYEDEMVYMPDLKVGVSDFLAEQARNQRNAKREFERARTLGTVATRMPQADSGISRNKRRKRRPRVVDQANKEAITVVEIAEDVRVYEFADQINQPIAKVIGKLFELGMMVTKNDFLDKDAIEILSDEFGVEVRTKDPSRELDYVSEYEEGIDESVDFATRPPIVTIMGHVDHGKTSLLDYIRSARVASGESGGITQHIGAYTVVKNDKEITFIDTPGHEAFSQMRARGANATDIVIIVVAADDGVMMQTKEAISHAKASGCPIIVAINKIDKPTANLDKVKAELAEADLTPIDWGGDIECVGVSAKTGDGVETLLETILIQAELLELTAQRDTFARAVVIESSLERGRGTVATVIVQNGTLKVGDNVVAGGSFGRIRAITDAKGKSIKALYPSEAGEIIGLDSVPSSGDILVAMDDLEKARDTAQKKSEYDRQRALSRSTKATLEDLHDLIAEGRLKRLPIILKSDAQGTLEALIESLEKLRNEEVKVDIIHSAVGAINESDVMLAGASESAVIMGFHVKPNQMIKDKAKEMGVRIASFEVIYDLLESVKKILGGMLSPVTEEQIAGKAEVRQIFEVPKMGKIAGSMVMDGEVIKGSIARVMRGEDEIFKGKIDTLKRFKDDVREVKKGLECGIGIAGFDAIQAGDIIEVYKAVEVSVEFEAE